VNGAWVQKFLYAGRLRPVAQLDGNNQVVSRFVYATHVNVPDYIVKSGVTYRVITDHLGSVRLVVNASTGAAVQRMDYDEWGNLLADSNPGFQPFGYAGGLYDTQTKLVRFGFRDYDPNTGRWTAKDPIGFAGGELNMYGYVVEDPVNSSDPEGLQGGFRSFFRFIFGRVLSYFSTEEANPRDQRYLEFERDEQLQRFHQYLRDNPEYAEKCYVHLNWVLSNRPGPSEIRLVTFPADVSDVQIENPFRIFTRRRIPEIYPYPHRRGIRDLITIP